MWQTQHCGGEQVKELSHGWSDCYSVVSRHVVAKHNVQIVCSQEVHHIQQPVQHTVIWQVAVAGALNHGSCSSIEGRDASAGRRGYAGVGHAALQLRSGGEGAVGEEAEGLQARQIIEAEGDLNHVEAQGDDALHLGLEVLAEAAGAVQQAVKHGVPVIKARPGDSN